MPAADTTTDTANVSERGLRRLKGDQQEYRLLRWSVERNRQVIAVPLPNLVWRRPVCVAVKEAP